MRANWEFMTTGRIQIGEGTIDRSQPSGASGTSISAPKAAAPVFSTGTKKKSSTREKDARKDLDYAHALMAHSDLLLDEAEAQQKKTEDKMRAINEYKLSQVDAYMAHSDAILASFEDNTNEMSEFAKAAAQNMQSAFADFLFDPFSGSVKEMALDFVNVLRRMAAEAVAAAIFQKMIGAGANSSVGWISSLASSFAGAKDSGGSVPSGSWAIAGEKGPEIITGPANVTSRMDTAKIFDTGRSADNGGIRIINSVDPALFDDWAGSSAGEKAIMNIVSRNGRSIRQISAR